MGNFTYNLPFNLVNGTTADALEVMANYNAGRNSHNAAFNGTTGHGHTGATGDGPILSGSSIVLPELPPIGTILAHYDYNGGLTFDSTKWRYCDGSAGVVFTGIGAQTLPDLSGRYLVGFGTDGGGDIDTAPWATAAVGNAGHTINIAHTHTVAAHTHDLASHTHTGNSHTHSLPANTGGVMTDSTAPLGASASAYYYDSAGVYTAGRIDFLAGAGQVEGYHFHDLAGVTGSGGSGSAGGGPSPNTSDSASPATDSQLSATQSIQPRSIRVRFIIRIA